LNLDKRTIKSEHSFAGIEDVTPDSADPTVIHIKFKVREATGVALAAHQYCLADA